MADISSLGYGPHSAKIKVRVLRIWDCASLQTYYEMMTNFLLVDAQNIRHWAIVDIAERARMMDSLCEGLTYYIQNFRIVQPQASWKPIDTDKTIVLCKNTQVYDCLYGSSIPRFRFDLCPMESVPSMLGTTRTLIDVCGVIVRVGRIARQANGIMRLDISLMNNRLTELQVSLWGKKVTTYEIESRIHRRKNTVLVVTGLIVKRRAGNIYLSSTNATSFCSNPDYDGVLELGSQVAAAYGEMICQVPSNYPTLQAPLSTLFELQNTGLWVHQRYCCKVGLTDILLCPPDPASSCIACNQEVTIDANRFYCTECGRNFVSPIRGPEVTMHVHDGTSDAAIMLKGEELRQLTGSSIEDLFEIYKNVNGSGDTPMPVRRVWGSTCTIEVELTPSNFSNNEGYLVATWIIEYTMLIKDQQAHYEEARMSKAANGET